MELPVRLADCALVLLCDVSDKDKEAKRCCQWPAQVTVLGCLHSPLTLCTTSSLRYARVFMDGLVRSFTVTVRSCFGDFIDLTSMPVTVLFSQHALCTACVMVLTRLSESSWRGGEDARRSEI
jgi:hypothetical protein